MAKIKVLDKHVSELIAAGEVVERPSSVIKELVENSIDAGSSVITVEIRGGGITFMRVTDNGCGIDNEDVSTAFLRHATSKVTTGDDLDSIATLGFRGEALASISAVSHIELITKTQDNSTGTRVVCDGGEITDVAEAGCPGGTTIIVRDLFYNTPARMKFLKKDVTEGNSIAGILDKVALSHPEISLRLIREGKEVLHTPGDNKLKSAVYAVFGKDFSNGLIPVNYELNGIKVWGFISSPSASRPNRTMQNFFINGRCIRSCTSMVALEEAYKGSITVGKFPACVLHMDMNFSTVDVNVHPAKLEVRFANEKPVFDAVYHSVKSALTAGDTPKVMSFNRQLTSPFIENTQKPVQTKISQPQPEVSQPKRQAEITPTTQSFIDNIKKSVFSDTTKEYQPTNPVKTVIEGIIDDVVFPTEPNIPEKPQPVQALPPETPVSDIASAISEEINTKVIGEAFGTYIILQYGKDKLMLIDKHAAHERLLYEKLKSEGTGTEAQSLLTPIPLTLEKEDYNSVINNLEKLSDAGFEIDDFGAGTVLIRTAPLSFDGQDAAQSVLEIANYLTNMKTAITTDYMDWVYHNIACRAAIKAGDRSKTEELVALAKELEENPQVRYCPHGRPIYVIIKKRDLEKEFNRI